MNGSTTVPEITALELARAAEAGEEIQVLDVRAPFRLQNGYIDLLPDDRFHNIPGSALVAMRDPEQVGIDPSVPVAVVCYHGNDSKVISSYLNTIGYRAASVEGGMAAWMRLLIPRPLEAPCGFDHLIQYDRIGKGALAYLLISDSQALLIDPPTHAHPILADMDRLGGTLIGVAETHVHADYLSGSAAISRAFDVPYHLHPADNVDPYEGIPGRLSVESLEDGTRIPVGRGVVTVLHTPGHTEGSVTFLVGGEAALTGDFIFVDSVGRPDLAGRAAEWSGLLWRSIERARREWSPDLSIYPGHYSGESERRKDRAVGDRFASLLDRNDPLRFPEEDTFLEWVDRNARDFPDAYRVIKRANAGLLELNEAMAEELEFGKNECAIGGN
jgi:glyoxylase-like metal-dependent hydrolase (beta-lactamase superfamily II)